MTYLLEHILETPLILAWMESAKLSKVDRDLKREIYPTNILNVNSVIHQSQLNNNWKLNPTSQRDNSKSLSIFKIAPHRSSRPKVFCKKVFLEISQNLQENNCARVSFLIKSQVLGLQLY